MFREDGGEEATETQGARNRQSLTNAQASLFRKVLLPIRFSQNRLSFLQGKKYNKIKQRSILSCLKKQRLTMLRQLVVYVDVFLKDNMLSAPANASKKIVEHPPFYCRPNCNSIHCHVKRDIYRKMEAHCHTIE